MKQPIRFGADGVAIPLTLSGQVTKDTFDLNRPQLVAERTHLDDEARNLVVSAIAPLALTHDAATLASALFDCLYDVDRRNTNADGIARLLEASGISPEDGSVPQPHIRESARRAV